MRKKALTRSEENEQIQRFAKRRLKQLAHADKPLPTRDERLERFKEEFRRFVAIAERWQVKRTETIPRNLAVAINTQIAELRQMVRLASAQPKTHAKRSLVLIEDRLERLTDFVAYRTKARRGRPRSEVGRFIYWGYMVLKEEFGFTTADAYAFLNELGKPADSSFMLDSMRKTVAAYESFRRSGTLKRTAIRGAGIKRQ